MACQFSIALSGNADAVLAKAKSTIQSQGGNFQGDTSKGEFDVAVFGNKIVGVYQVIDELLNITITDKPFMVPCSAIEGFLKAQLK